MTRSTRASGLARAVLALALAIGAATADAQPVPGFDVDIVLSPRAAERLQATQEGLTIDASFSGEPKAGAENQANEVGRISLGVERLERPGRPGRVHVSGTKVQAERLAWVQGEVKVNVNVYSSRRSSPDNILSCDFIDADLARVVAAQPITLRCALISEGADTALKP